MIGFKRNKNISAHSKNEKENFYRICICSRSNYSDDEVKNY